MISFWGGRRPPRWHGEDTAHQHREVVRWRSRGPMNAAPLQTGSQSPRLSTASVAHPLVAPRFLTRRQSPRQSRYSRGT